ncbi:MAG: hypothetical protein M3Q07_23195, partial [Pseudobdellovibrionaceae bacterium]|nr:hypothetical protein [Pseudobdellovibrionaceae bacterium]
VHKHVMDLLYQRIMQMHFVQERGITPTVRLKNTAEMFPHLLGTERESRLFIRWELFLRGVNFDDVDDIYESLSKEKVSYAGVPLRIYCES